MNFHPISRSDIWWSNRIERTILQKLSIIEEICFPDEYRSQPDQFKKILLLVIKEIEIARIKNYLLGIDFMTCEISDFPKEIAENIRNYAEKQLEEIKPRGIGIDDIVVLCETIKRKLKYITDASYESEWIWLDYEFWNENVFFDLYYKLDTFIRELP